MSEKIEITIERDEDQVSIYSTDPLIFIARGAADVTDRELLVIYGNALEAHRDSLPVSV